MSLSHDQTDRLFCCWHCLKTVLKNSRLFLVKGYFRSIWTWVFTSSPCQEFFIISWIDCGISTCGLVSALSMASSRFFIYLITRWAAFKEILDPCFRMKNFLKNCRFFKMNNFGQTYLNAILTTFIFNQCTSWWFDHVMNTWKMFTTLTPRYADVKQTFHLVGNGSWSEFCFIWLIIVI